MALGLKKNITMKRFYHVFPSLPLEHCFFKKLGVTVDGFAIVENAVLAGCDFRADRGGERSVGTKPLGDLDIIFRIFSYAIGHLHLAIES